jgi:pyruvate dehydrogenase phosphatase
MVTDSSVLVANTGDSRALLVKRAAKPGGADDVELPEGTQWVSELHTADSLSEQERLHALHPNERDVVHCRQKIIELDGDGKITSMRWAACYVKGRLQPTRAFGDFYLKDARAVEVCPELVPASSFSPPYIEVTPSINEWQRESGSLLVLATDGLWDYVSPQQVVDLVRRLPRDDVQAMAAGLIDLALEIAAEATAGEFSVADLKAMPQGYERRSIHDDITVLVIAL